MLTRGQVVELLSTRVKYLRVYVMPFYLVLRIKFIYNFWPGLIALAHRAAPPLPCSPTSPSQAASTAQRLV